MRACDTHWCLVAWPSRRSLPPFGSHSLAANSGTVIILRNLHFHLCLGPRLLDMVLNKDESLHWTIVGSADISRKSLQLLLLRRRIQRAVSGPPMTTTLCLCRCSRKTPSKTKMKNEFCRRSTGSNVSPLTAVPQNLLRVQCQTLDYSAETDRRKEINY